MDYAIGHEDGRLVVRLTGAPSEGEIRSMLKAMLEHGTVSRALIEVRVAFGLDPVSVLSLVNALGPMGFPPDYRFAVLLVDDAARDAAVFAETAAANRGRAIKVFKARDQALAWLAER